MSYHVTNQGVGQELVHLHIIKGMYECGNASVHVTFELARD